MIGIVYEAINKQTGHVYIGQTTTDLQKRKKNHEILARTHYENQSPFKAALRIFGVDGFNWFILAKCKTREELNLTEKKWIKELQSYNPQHGYNMRPGGSGIKNKRTGYNQEIAVNFRMPKNLYLKLKKQAEENRRSVSAEIVLLVEKAQNE